MNDVESVIYRVLAHPRVTLTVGRQSDKIKMFSSLLREGCTMTDVKDPPTRKQLAKLALIGLSILTLFAVGFLGLDYYVMNHGGVDVFIAVAPFCVFPYLIGMSIYVGFFMAEFAKGRWKHTWVWGIGGAALTVLFMIGFPVFLSPIFPYQSPVIFAFFAPVLSTSFIMFLISIRRKVNREAS